MSMVVPTRAITVYLWGERVGALSLGSDGYSRFQYFPEFVRHGVEIAPFEMPLSAKIYSAADFELPRKAFWGLPGAFADSLPDSFGNKLVVDWMVRNGYSPSEITALDRLAYIGSRGMGALVYEPELGPDMNSPTVLDMRMLVEEARLALNEDLSHLSGTDALREIIRVGTSAGGAQAKAVVAWNRERDVFSAGQENLPEGFEHWIIKFTPREDPGAGETEYSVYRKAIASGIDMCESRLCEVDGIRHFMTRRFDRDGDRRHLVQTYCALRHLPPGRVPIALCRYEGLFDTIIALEMGYGVLEQMFRRMVFNVLIGEHDDHTKNFSFMMRQGGKWELAPAYDLTGRHDSVADASMYEWSNKHALSVNGKFSSIGDADLLSVGERYGIGNANEILGEVKSAVLRVRI